MPQDVYDKVMMMAKRRGFIFPSFEIYGGVAGFYDYGPLGSQLKNNVENLWRKFYLLKDNCAEINTPTITLYDVLKASGHVDEFTDLTIDCKKCKQSFKLEALVEKDDLERGMVLAKKGTINPHTKFSAEVYVLTKEEGGRHTPFFPGYQPQFYIRTTDVTGKIELPKGVEMVMPGDNIQMEVELIVPVAIEEGMRFAIREGGHTVGAGVVSKIKE